MVRWFTQCLVVVTMLASLLHAQCLLACSLQASNPTLTAQTVESGGHSCCPNQANQTGQKSEKPCPAESPVISIATDDATAATTVVLPVTMLSQPGESLPAATDFHTTLTASAAPRASALSLLSSISVLRI